MPFQVQTY